MSCSKRKLDVEQDPDYEDSRIHEMKRVRLLEQCVKSGFKQKVSAVVCREFAVELSNKEKEVLEIQERLYDAQKTLHVLRYAIISSYYGRKQTQTVQNPEQPKRIHPAIKKLLGKHPKFPLVSPLEPRTSRLRVTASQGQEAGEASTSSSTETSAPAETETLSKIPRYIPPKGADDPHNIEVKEPRGVQHKVKKRLVIGNISKWIPIDTREDDASHKWMVYVRGPKEAPDVSGFISKVRFFLHPSYRPHDVVEISGSPFHLARRGWGEFPVRVQIHFIHPLNKPVDVIHQLKLDQTRTGLQTLGAETVVDIWLHRIPASSTATSSGEDRTDLISNKNENTGCEVVSYDGRTCNNQTNAVSEHRDGEDRTGDADCLEITLYESDGHKTIVHDREMLSVCEIKKEISERGESSLVASTARSDNVVFDNNNTDVRTSAKNVSELSGNATETKDKYTHKPSNCLLNCEVKSCDKNLESSSCTKNESIVKSGSFDHDYFGSSLTDNLSSIGVADPLNEFEIGKEITLSSSLESHEEIVTSVEEPTSETDLKLIKEPAQSSLQSKSNNSSNNLHDVPNNVLSCSSSSHNKIILTENLQLREQKYTTAGNNLVMTRKNIPSNSQNENELHSKSDRIESLVETKQPTQSFLNNETVKVPSKQPQVSNVLSKPTTLVKCMDKSGNVFYITVGGVNTKLSSNSPGKCEDQQPVKRSINSISTATSNVIKTIPKPDTKTVSLLTNSLLARGNQQQKTANNVTKNKATNVTSHVTFVPVTVPVMKSLISPKFASQTTQKISAAKTVTNNISTNQSTITGQVNNSVKSSPDPVRKLQQGAKANLRTLPMSQAGTSMLEGITSVESTNSITSVKSDQSRTSFLLTKPNTIIKINPTPSGSVDESNKLQTTVSPSKLPKGNSVLNQQTQGQTLLLVKDGQIFLLKQPTVTPNSSTAAVKSNSSVANSAREKLSQNTLTAPVSQPSSGAGAPNVSTVLNSLLLQSQANSGGAVVKVNQPLGVTKTYLSTSVKPGVSLLKKHVSAMPSPLAKPPKPEMERKEQDDQRLLFSGRTLVLNKANSRIVVNPKKPKYEDELKEVIAACKFPDVQKCVSWLLRHFPLVSPAAVDPDFRVLHPYAAPSEATFLQWNHGKRKAAEWQRAKAVRHALEQIGFSEAELWSTHNIVIWAKIHGHTPLPSNSQSAVREAKPPVSEQSSSDPSGTFTEPVAIMDWLETNLEDKRGSLEDDIEVDIVNIEVPTVKVKEESAPLVDLTVMDISPSDISEYMFVRETARELSIKMPPEQIIPGILYCAAERVMVQAMRSLIEDILRRSLGKAWERNSDRQPDSITMQDMRSAILDRPEFDLFTNIGLGVQAADIG